MTRSLSRHLSRRFVGIHNWWAKRRLDFWRWVVDYHLELAADHRDAADDARVKVCAALCDWALIDPNEK